MQSVFLACCRLLTSYNLRLSLKGTNLGSKDVQIMETTIIALSRNATHTIHLIKSPWCQDQKIATSTSLKSP